MRAVAPICVFSLLSLAACSDDGGEPAFTDTGGMMMVPGCTYSITTRAGAEPPRVSGKTIGPDPTPRHVHLGIVGDPMTSIVAQWRTKDDTTTAGSIRYGVGANLPEAQLTKEVQGLTFGYRASGTTTYRMHQAHLCGLEAGTTYSYQVGTGTSWSPIYTFHTAPDVVAHPDTESVISFIGDTRNAYDIWAQVIDLSMQRTPDLVLFSGDAITFGYVQAEWDTFFETSEPLFATVPMVSTNGNHEGNAVNYYSQVAMPGDQENFGFSYGFARIFVANDEPDDVTQVSTTIPPAMDADFAAHPEARWRILMHHQPMYSSGTVHGSNLELRTAWEPIIDKNHLDLVLNGHDHEYEISKPLAAGAVVPTTADGTVFVVAGGGGADLYGFMTPGFWTDYIESTHNGTVLHVRRDTLTLDAFRTDGSAIPMGFSKTKP